MDVELNISLNSPPQGKYEELDAWKKSHKRAFALKIPPDLKPEPTKIEKDKSMPDVGSYFQPKYDKLCHPKIREDSFSKLPKTSICEIISKQKKFVPSPAAYKIEIKTFDKICSSPLVKQKRH